MDTLKQAFELLELPETATKEEVEKRYMILVRRARAQEARGLTEDQEKKVDFEQVNRAYRYILEQEALKDAEKFNQDKYGKYKGMAKAAEKTDHFFHYYRFHLIGAIILVVLLGFGIKEYNDRQAEKARLASLPPIDVHVMFHGEYYLPGNNHDTTELEEALLAQFPQWQRVSVGLTYVPTEMRSEMDMASLQKAMVTLMTEKADVYILDRYTFEQLSAQGMFLPLDEYATGSWKQLVDEGQLQLAQLEEDTEPHVYGIDITGHPQFSDLPVLSGDRIAAIRLDTNRFEKAIEFIERYIAD